MIGNEDVFRFQEGYVLYPAVTTDILTCAANDSLAPILVQRRWPPAEARSERCHSYLVYICGSSVVQVTVRTAVYIA
jgi:hypothetical protein